MFMYDESAEGSTVSSESCAHGDDCCQQQLGTVESNELSPGLQEATQEGSEGCTGHPGPTGSEGPTEPQGEQAPQGEQEAKPASPVAQLLEAAGVLLGLGSLGRLVSQMYRPESPTNLTEVVERVQDEDAAALIGKFLEQAKAGDLTACVRYVLGQMSLNAFTISKSGDQVTLTCQNADDADILFTALGAIYPQMFLCVTKATRPGEGAVFGRMPSNANDSCPLLTKACEYLICDVAEGDGSNGYVVLEFDTHKAEAHEDSASQ